MDSSSATLLAPVLFVSFLLSFGSALNPELRSKVSAEIPRTLEKHGFLLPEDFRLAAFLRQGAIAPELLHLSRTHLHNPYLQEAAIALEGAVCSSRCVVVHDPFSFARDWLIRRHTLPMPKVHPLIESISTTPVVLDVDCTPIELINTAKKCLAQSRPLILDLQTTKTLKEGVLEALLIVLQMADHAVRLRCATGMSNDGNAAVKNPKSLSVDWRLKQPKPINTIAGRRDLIWSGFQFVDSKVINFSRADQMENGIPAPRQRFAFYVLVPDCPWNSLWGSRHGTGEATRAFPLPFWSVCHVVSMDVRPVHPVDPFVLSFARICEERRLAQASAWQEKVAQIGVQLQLVEEALLKVSSGDSGVEKNVVKVVHAEQGHTPKSSADKAYNEEGRKSLVVPPKMTVALALTAELQNHLVDRSKDLKEGGTQSVLVNQHLFRRMEELCSQADKLSEQLTDMSLKLQKILLNNLKLF